jgi:bifunctional N-acetylglutamate synthase/kinase
MNDQRHKAEDLIVRLLRSLGSKKEVDGYLKLFSEVDEKRFAIIKVSGGVVATELDALASSIAFLDNVGLTPVVLHGAGPQLTQALAEANISTTADNGERRTTDRGIEIARKVFQTENLKIVDALESLGVDARPVPTGVFEAELIDRRRLGYVGKVSGVNLQLIESSIRGEQIPVIASLAETPTGQTLNVNADEACRELAKALVPFKVVFLSPDDAMRDEHGAIISTINLAEDYDQLHDASWLKSSMKKKLEEAKLILDALPRSSSVAIASPENLARELFTHKGAGTIIRRGERVQRFESLDGIDRDRLRALLEDSFGRKLHLDYFDKKPFFRIYLAESYRAVAILTDEAGVPYLDKFAVTSDAQGDGIGASLWQHIARDNRQLFWRARIDNEVNPWYATRATGTYKTDKWMVFWYGIHDFQTIESCVSRALEMPATLKAQGPVGTMMIDNTALPTATGPSR